MLKKSSLLVILLLILNIFVVNRDFLNNIIGIPTSEEKQKIILSEHEMLSIKEFREIEEKRKIIRQRTFMFRYLCDEGLKNHKMIENVLYTKFRNNKWKLTSYRPEINEHRTYIFEKDKYQCEIYLYNTHMDFFFRYKNDGFY